MIVKMAAKKVVSFILSTSKQFNVVSTINN